MPISDFIHGRNGNKRTKRKQIGLWLIRIFFWIAVASSKQSALPRVSPAKYTLFDPPPAKEGPFIGCGLSPRSLLCRALPGYPVPRTLTTWSAHGGGSVNLSEEMGCSLLGGDYLSANKFSILVADQTSTKVTVHIFRHK
jgi:hypothetical protein